MEVAALMHNAEQMQNESKQDEAFSLKAANQGRHVEPRSAESVVYNGADGVT